MKHLPNSTILRQSRHGDGTASAELADMAYEKLRDLAARYMKRERRGHTLQPTALVHEAYLLLIDQKDAGERDRDHFISIAACAMRRVLVDHARSHKALKRGGEARRVPLQSDVAVGPGPDLDLLGLDEALSRLQTADPRRARVVELRFFGGLSCEDAARILDVSARTVENDWRAARAWLHRELTRGTSK